MLKLGLVCKARLLTFIGESCLDHQSDGAPFLAWHQFSWMAHRSIYFGKTRAINIGKNHHQSNQSKPRVCFRNFQRSSPSSGETCLFEVQTT